MEAKLREMFPSGEWGIGQRSWMVKDGQYFWAVADIVDGEIVLTERGKQLAAPVAKAAPEVVIPEFLEPAAEEVHAVKHKKRVKS